MKKVLILMVLFMGVSCSDAKRAKMFSFGDGRNVKCYSGGKVIYSGASTGQIRSEENSDGYYFKDTRGVLVEVSGDCLLESK